MTRYKLEFGFQHLWIGVYWETWKTPYRTDIWAAIPFMALHIIHEYPTIELGQVWSKIAGTEPKEDYYLLDKVLIKNLYVDSVWGDFVSFTDLDGTIPYDYLHGAPKKLFLHYYELKEQ